MWFPICGDTTSVFEWSSFSRRFHTLRQKSVRFEEVIGIHGSCHRSFEEGLVGWSSLHN
jgi:hypothetical protein